MQTKTEGVYSHPQQSYQIDKFSLKAKKPVLNKQAF